jgi:hypothetical protein
MRTHTYRSVLIGHAPPQQELTWWAAAAATAAIATSIGIAASLYLVPAAAAALAPQVGFAGAHLVLAAIYGLAALVVLSVLRLAGAR